MKLAHEKLKVVNDFLEQEDTPVNIIALAYKLGIRIHEKELRDDISGKIGKNKEYGGPSGFAILVNKKHYYARIRFTIAHEIAHYVLYERDIGDGVFDNALYRGNLSNKIESQANSLAANILMPWALINKYSGILKTKKLAEKFQVSEQAMTIRLAELGI